ncbi:MAG: hypothetical protein JWM32_1827 [Verrucomicrobia bacterium]|nr:hypothetical protein [Verrucomicrobiota bacterium]
MKKTFPLHQPGKADARVVDAIKADIRRYVKRERRKPLPADAGIWVVECAVGVDQAGAKPTLLADVGKAVDEVVATGVDSVYVEVVAKPAALPPRPPRETPLP